MSSIDAVGAAALTAGSPANASSGSSVFDVQAFRAAFEQQAPATPGPSSDAAGNASATNPAMRSVVGALDALDSQGAALGEQASRLSSGGTMTPNDMIMLTVQAHEFLFKAEITANVANRTSDGIQQLFRQQV